MKQLEVVAAIIEHNNKVLCMQRNVSKYPYVSLKYEFPGGKIESGETNTQALEREIREEMDMNVFINDKNYFMTVYHEYPDFAITMHVYIIKVNNPQFTRKEHINHIWALPQEMSKLDWAAADRPIVNKLLEELNAK